MGAMAKRRSQPARNRKSPARASEAPGKPVALTLDVAAPSGPPEAIAPEPLLGNVGEIDALDAGWDDVVS